MSVLVAVVYLLTVVGANLALAHFLPTTSPLVILLCSWALPSLVVIAWAVYGVSRGDRRIGQ